MKIGLLGLVFIVLLILKLTGAAVLSWWVVFAPLIISVVLVTIVLLIFLCGVVIAAMVD